MSTGKQYGRCPTCNKRFEWDSESPWRPFCSERCRLIDLGEWLDEGHRIPDKTPGKPFLPPEDDDTY
ncbi:DNA gyrase inhibitor YacG [Solemya velesiana gill symbiont]|uniref:DNA gyrase inhibitor YacG n=1 Tax=Solemya velesiana gill symbiont TaxID=1918948 RepID=UPI00099611D4|nr:DNA gyrase inhibitor YacG [Solemya velesiana gill symbiont]